MGSKWLSKEQIKKLRKHCKEREKIDLAYGRWIGVRNRMLVEFLLGTGLRASECRDTQVRDISLSVKNGDIPYVKVRTLKRKQKVVDVVELDKELAGLLSAYLKELKRYGKKADGEAYLFSGRGGKKAPDLPPKKWTHG